MNNVFLVSFLLRIIARKDVVSQLLGHFFLVGVLKLEQKCH